MLPSQGMGLAALTLVLVLFEFQMDESQSRSLSRDSHSEGGSELSIDEDDLDTVSVSNECVDLAVLSRSSIQSKLSSLVGSSRDDSRLWEGIYLNHMEETARGSVHSWQLDSSDDGSDFSEMSGVVIESYGQANV